MKQHVIKNIRSFIKNKRAVSSIEFTLTIGIFFLVLFMIFEFGRIAMTSAYWDLAIAEGIRVTKNNNLHNSGSDYSKYLKDTLEQTYAKNSTNPVIKLFVVQKPTINVCLNYAKDLNAMVPILSKPCVKSDADGNDMPVARYYITYDYKFEIKLPFLQDLTSSMFTRQFLVVQEYERSEFN